MVRPNRNNSSDSSVSSKASFQRDNVQQNKNVGNPKMKNWSAASEAGHTLASFMGLQQNEMVILSGKFSIDINTYTLINVRLLQDCCKTAARLLQDCCKTYNL